MAGYSGRSPFYGSSPGPLYQGSPHGGSPWRYDRASPYRSPGSYAGESSIGGYTDYQPAVPVPILSGSGDEAIPDFLKLVDEANERSGVLRKLEDARKGLSYDEVSGQLERPSGIPLVIDGDGAEVLEAQDQGLQEESGREGLGPSAMIQISRELTRLSMRPTWRGKASRVVFEEEGDDEVEAEGGDASVPVNGHTKARDAGVVGGDSFVFHPLSHVAWEKAVRSQAWADEEDDEPEGYDARQVEEEDDDEVRVVRGVGNGLPGGMGALLRGAGSRMSSVPARPPPNVVAQWEALLERERILKEPIPLNRNLNSDKWERGIALDWDAASAEELKRKREQQAAQARRMNDSLSRLIVDYNDPSIYFNPPPLPHADLQGKGLVTVGTDPDPVKSAEQLKMTRRRLAIPTIEHAECAVRHDTSMGRDGGRVAITEADGRAFHRPRMDPKQDVRWMLRLPASAKKAKGGRDEMKAIKTVADLRPVRDHVVLMEYVEERPLMLSNAGMASKLINFWRLSKSDLRTDEAAQSDGGVTGDVGVVGKAQRTSRETIARNSHRIDPERMHTGVPVVKEGHTVVLYPDDPSPFIGDIETQHMQRALHTNMFKAPVFEHAPKSSDFLLSWTPPHLVKDGPDVDDAEGNEPKCYVVREIPKIYLVGQQEPLVELMEPDTIAFQGLFEKAVGLAVAKRLNVKAQEARREGRVFEGIKAVDLWPSFWPSAYLVATPKMDRKAGQDRMNEVVKRACGKVARERSETGAWELGVDDMDALLREVSPEETVAAAVRHMMDHGINLLGKLRTFEPVRLEPVLTKNLQNLMQNRETRADRAKRALQLTTGQPNAAQAREMEARLRTEFEEVRQMILVGAFIMDEVQVAPWYLTKFYNIIHNEKGEGGMFKLTGLGDPSGLGEGFSFLPRVAREPKRSYKEVLPTLEPELREILTDVPLFRMPVKTMNEVIEFLFATQKRLVVHRLMVAGYETELEELLRLRREEKKLRVQTMLDVEGGEGKQSAGVHEYINLCNSIWNKQVNVLSDPSGQFVNEDDLDFGGGTGGTGPSVVRSTSLMSRATSEMDLDPAETARQIAEYREMLARKQEEERRRRLAEAAAQGAQPLPWHKPTKVVKRIIKETDKEGKESYRVDFYFDEALVRTVEYRRDQQLQKLREERMVRMNEQGKFKVSKNLKGVRDAVTKTKKDTMISLTGLKEKEKQANLMKEQQKKEEREAELAFYKRTYDSAAKEKRSQRQQRPLLRLSQALEPVIAAVLKQPFAKPFLNKPLKSVDLKRIQKRVTKFKYNSRQDMLDDMEELVADALEEYKDDEQMKQRALGVKTEFINGVKALNDEEVRALEEAVLELKGPKKHKRKKRKRVGEEGVGGLLKAARPPMGAGPGGISMGLMQPRGPMPPPGMMMGPPRHPYNPFMGPVPPMAAPYTGGMLQPPPMQMQPPPGMMPPHMYPRMMAGAGMPLPPPGMVSPPPGHPMMYPGEHPVNSMGRGGPWGPGMPPPMPQMLQPRGAPIPQMMMMGPPRAFTPPPPGAAAAKPGDDSSSGEEEVIEEIQVV